MLSKDKAVELVKRHLSSLYESEDIEVVLLDDHTIECGFGWVFFYNSKAYIETEDFSKVLAGNSPLIVDKLNSSIHETGTAEPVEYYIRNYKTLGTPHRKA